MERKFIPDIIWSLNSAHLHVHSTSQARGPDPRVEPARMTKLGGITNNNRAAAVCSPEETLLSAEKYVVDSPSAHKRRRSCHAIYQSKATRLKFGPGTRGMSDDNVKVQGGTTSRRKLVAVTAIASSSAGRPAARHPGRGARALVLREDGTGARERSTNEVSRTRA